MTKFLVKISQFKFLINTDKNIFVYKLSLSLNISYFRLFFMQKLDPQQNKGVLGNGRGGGERGSYAILGALKLPAR